MDARALAGMCLGNLVEFYDFAVFGASAATLALLLTARDGGLTSVFVVLAAAFLVRPVGAVVVGRISDRVGRRVPFVVMTVLTCVATALVGVLPTAASAGLAAAVALAVLRCLQAFCTGGETSTSVAYLYESARPGRRGRIGGFHLASAAAGMAVGLAAVLVVHVVLSPRDLLAWGWRLPFLAAVPLGLAVVWARRRLSESTDFVRAARPVPFPDQGTPGAARLSAALALPAVARLLRTRPRTVTAGMLVAGAFSATVTLWFVYVPAFLLSARHASALTALGPAAAGLLACAAAAPFAGSLSDRVGRPPVLIGSCLVLALIWPITTHLTLDGPSSVGLVLASLAIGAGLSGFVLASYLPDTFAVAERATGIGLTYGVGTAVLGGVAPLVAGWLVARSGLAAIAEYPVLCSAVAALALALVTAKPDASAARLLPPAAPAAAVGD